VKQLKTRQILGSQQRPIMFVMFGWG
jgi:hypothetical protein